MKTILIALLVVAGSLGAQTTTLVNGPNLPAAIQAAKPGDILLVSGTYATLLKLTIDKPLFIHGLPGARLFVASGIEVKAIPAGASFVLQGFEITSLSIQNCPGRVLCAGLTVSNPSLAVSALNCVDLAIEDCTLGPLTLDNCTTTLAGTKCEGVTFNPRYIGIVTAGVLVLGGSLRAADVTMIGGTNRHANTQFANGEPGLLIGRSGHAELTGATVLRAGLGLNNAVPAAGGSGTFLYDPAVAFTPYNGPSIDPNLTATQRVIPVTTMVRAPIGGTGDVRTRGPAGATFALFFGAPGNPVSLPGIGGTLTVFQPILLQLGTLGSNGVSTFGFRIPADPLLRGRLFRWQGGTITNGVAQWAHPVTECHY